MQAFSSEISRRLAGIVGVDDPGAVQWNVPQREDQGDLSTNFAMTLAKTLKKPPREIAQEFVNALDWQQFHVERAEVAGPGFLNLWLKPTYYHLILEEVLNEGASFGRTEAGKGQRILVEFVSANPTGPLNVVSARAAAIGDSLVRVLNKAGYDAHAEFYVNDAGRQIRRLGASVIARARGEEVPEDGYHGEDIQEIARELFPTGEVPEGEDIETVGRRAAWRNVERQKTVLNEYGVAFDRWYRETELHEGRKPELAFDALSKADAVYEKDGATWFRGSSYGDDEDRVIITSEGRPTYFLPDIAYHLDKAERGYSTAIDLLGPDHLDYVNRMQAAMKALGHDGFLEVLIVQQVHLLEGGEKVKMSKRAGKLITLEELVGEVGKDVARFFFLQRKTSSPLEFDLDLAKEQSDRNPVFYVQYAHTRIRSILRQDGCPTPENADLSLLLAREELDLIKHLDLFPDTIARAAEGREPQKIVNYLHNLATIFHKFYNVHRVITDDLELSKARAALIEGTAVVLSEGLRVLGITAPERM